MKRALLLASLAASPPLAAEEAPPAFAFRDVTRTAGVDFVHATGESGRKYLVETMGSGAAFFDYDLDGDADLYLVNGGALPGFTPSGPIRGALYRNEGGGRFRDVTAEARLVDEGYGMGAVSGDYDNDGDPDLYLTHWGPNRLYRNEGDGTFSDVTEAAGVGHPLWSASAAFADLDGDGWLDLYVANYVDWSPSNHPECWHRGGRQPQLSYCLPDAFRGQPDELYRNRGDGSFEAVGAAASIARADGKGLGVLVFDDDGDGRPDVYVANDTVPNFFFRNLGALRFREEALERGVAYDLAGNALAGMGVDAADADRDGDLDLFVTNFQREMNTLYRRDADGFWSDVSLPAGVGAPSLDRLGFGTLFADLDSDGGPEIVVANGHLDSVTEDDSPRAQPNQLFWNRGDGRFREVSVGGDGLGAPKVSRGLAAADWDGDHDLDLVVSNCGDGPDLLRNDTPGGRALRLRLVGRQANRDAVGARVEALVGNARILYELKAGTSYLSDSERVVHVGLGTGERVDGLRITWPGTRLDEALGPQEAGSELLIVEGRGVVARFPPKR